MQQEEKKHSALYFFYYFKKIVGYRIYIYIFLNFMVGLLDGFGLAMFIPLLKLATNTKNDSESLENLQFIVVFLQKINLDLTLTTALIIMVSMFLFKGLVNYIKIIYYIGLRTIAIKKVRYRLVNGFRNLSYEGFTTLDAGTIQNTMIAESQRLFTAFAQYFSTLQGIVMIFTYNILAFFANWKFAIMVAIGGVLSNFLYKKINKITKENARKLSYEGHDFNGNLIQSVHYFKYLKATNYFSVFQKKLAKNIEGAEAITYKLGKLGAITESLREPIIIVIIASVIILQVNFLGSNFDSIVVSLLLFYRALAILATTQGNWNNFLNSSAGLESVENLLGKFKNYEEKENQNVISKINNIQVENTSVIFGDKTILNKLSFTIPNKHSIAFVGESGAGKTTLANVICGLLPPNKGKIICDGNSLYESNLNSFRNKVGYITQEPVIFDDNIYNNVTFSDEKTPENLEKFNKVIEMVSLKNFLENLTFKEETPLGNNGVLISGGQKQRISIARELYKDVELLIMDEATSALDSETEKFIKDNIDMLYGKFTMIIIAHRLSTIKNVDTIYLMENGNIIASGSYDELLNSSNKFRKMVDLQEV